MRNTGIGAPARVARFLKSGGVPSVMAEIGRIDSSYVKGIYFKELFKQATLTPEQYRQAMAQASREMKCDYELAQMLIAVADRLPSDDTSRDAYFTAASTISSDYELRRVYSTMLKKGPVSAADARRNPDALDHDRFRLRAVGAAAADHVAADARRPEPRRVLPRDRHDQQRLRAAPRAVVRRHAVAGRRHARGRADAGRDDQQRP